MRYQKFAQVYGFEFEGNIVYVGVTIADIRQRISKHYQCSEYGRSGAVKVNEWLKTKPKFNIKVIEYCPVETRFEREKFWIEHYKTIETGLNSPIYKDAAGRQKGCTNPSGENHYMYGKTACKAAVKASVRARIGKRLSDEHRQKMREGHARRKALLKN